MSSCVCKAQTPDCPVCGSNMQAAEGYARITLAFADGAQVLAITRPHVVLCLQVGLETHSVRSLLD